jgi:protein-S-isoprenylcysteine O-methyltransferase Ste14
MNQTPDAKTDLEQSLLEFGGPIGNGALVLGLPLITYYFYFAAMFNGGALLPTAAADVAGFLEAIRPTAYAAALYLGWFGLQAALQAWAPGPVVEGTELPGGGRLKYKMNGLVSVGLTLVAVGAALGLGVFEPTVIYDHFGALLTVMVVFAFAFSAFLYVYGKMYDQQGHLHGHPVADFWMGTGHNPRLPPGGLFDLKFFCESRPGLILWMLMNLSFAAQQYEAYGFVSVSMVLVCAFQAFYVMDYFLNEPAILTTMDIKHENFGFMLCFGDLVWVPMTYTLQAFYLVDHVHDLPWWAAALIVATNVTGLWLFRAVNNQKNQFRRDPENAEIWGKPAEYIQTQRGSKLLLSGFWGWSRHFNYVGDLLMAVSWSLPCLFGSLLPWFYPVYFAILLIHRERRDHEFCSRKYGKDWDDYCERVPWRILPGVY